MRILSSDGTKPVAARELLLRVEGRWHARRPFLTDADGVLVIDPAPPHPFRLVASDPREPKKLVTDLGPITIPSGAKEASFELRMPAGKQ